MNQFTSLLTEHFDFPPPLLGVLFATSLRMILQNEPDLKQVRIVKVRKILS